MSSSSSEPANNTSTSSTSTNTTTSNSIFTTPQNTRLVTIAAHVDHGKTSLADNLCATNGLVSERAAGTLRYLDADPEEQRRGITMRSSAIGLRHTYTPSPPSAANKKKKNNKNTTSTENTNNTNNYIIHLVDSPGHTDFSREVSSSMVACDAALLVVDAVEGMGARTQQVFRETAAFQLTPILVVNKIDRYKTELCLTPTEAYLRLRSLLETINAAASAMITSAQQQQQQQNDDDMKHQKQRNEKTQNTSSSSSSSSSLEQLQQQQQRLWTFDPAHGNVIFASALFGWGFTVTALCRSLFRNKIVPVKPMLLRQFLFGDYKLKKQDRTKILKWKQQQHQHSSEGDDENNNLPLFAQYALQPIWDIYDGVEAAAAAVGILNNNNNNNNSSSSGKKPDAAAKIRADTPGMDQVLTALQAGSTASISANASTATSATTSSTLKTVDDLQTVLTRTGAGGSGADAVLRAILRRYRPLAETVLNVVCEYAPSPASETRLQTLTLAVPPAAVNDDSDDDDDKVAKTEFARLQQAVQTCDASGDAPAVAHVCKFLSTDQLHVRDAELESFTRSNNDNSDNHSDNNLILGLARVLSGRLRSNSEYFVYGPKYNNRSAKDEPQPPKRKIRLYLLMGSSFVRVEEVPAGHLCAIYGLEDVQFKTATLSDNPYCQPLRSGGSGEKMTMMMRPLVKVHIEPENTADAECLERGLAKLSLADAAVEVTATDKGERILACLGELHLEQSILDLERVYCGKEGIKIRISDPIVDFAETTDWFETENEKKNEVENYAAFFDNKSSPLRQTTVPPYNEEEGIAYAKHGRTRSILSGRGAAISMRAIPLASCVHKSLQKCKVLVDDDEAGCEEELIKLGSALNCKDGNGQVLSAEAVLCKLLDGLCSIDENGNALFESASLRNGSAVYGIESAEVYIPPIESSTKAEQQENGEDGDETKDLTGVPAYESLRSIIRRGEMQAKEDDMDVPARTDVNKAANEIWVKAMKGSAVAGFQLAVRSGPVCEEPMRNILVVLEGVEVALTKSGDDANGYKESKQLAGGMVVSALRFGIRCALLSRPIRLMEGHLRLTLHSSLAGLGSLYSVLSKRRGKVVDDSMVDGTDLLMITASIPQAEAFGLAPELFGKTSGEVTAPEMIFSHWERLDVDPFWIPTSEEEREDFGELQSAGDSSTGIDNTALSYIRKVRKRKGLTVDSSRTVLNAEKQRTLKR